MRKLFLACLLLVLCPTASHAQALAPAIHHQFLDGSGKPLAGGFLYSYQAGTSTFQATYADPGLTIQNANPIPLDATGSPSNGSGAQVEVWLSNASYKFCAYNSALVQQWCMDNITTYLGLLNQANTWTFAQTFTQPITDTATDNQLIFGATGNQTTLDLPPPTGNIILHTPNTSDTLVGRNTTDTLTKKTLTNPVLNGVNAQTGTSYTVAASDEQFLVTLNNASAVAVTLPAATTAGFGSGARFSFRNLGVGTVTITPTTSQIDGATTLVLLTGQGVDVYSDGANYESQKGSAPLANGSSVGCTSTTPVTVTNNNALQNLMSCTIPANTLVQGSLLSVDVIALESTISAQNLQIGFTLGGVVICNASVNPGTSNNQQAEFKGSLMVLTTGPTGTGWMGCQIGAGGGNAIENGGGGSGSTPVSVNTTISNVLQITEQMSVANAGNTITGEGLKAVIF